MAYPWPQDSVDFTAISIFFNTVVASRLVRPSVLALGCGGSENLNPRYDVVGECDKSGDTLQLPSDASSALRCFDAEGATRALQPLPLWTIAVQRTFERTLRQPIRPRDSPKGCGVSQRAVERLAEREEGVGDSRAGRGWCGRGSPCGRGSGCFSLSDEEQAG